MAGMHPMAKRWVPDGQIGTTTVLRHESAVGNPYVGGELLASLLMEQAGLVPQPNICSTAAALEESWRSPQHSSSSWAHPCKASHDQLDVVVQVPLQATPGMPHWLPWLIPPQHLHLTLTLTHNSSHHTSSSTSSSRNGCSSQVADSALSFSSNGTCRCSGAAVMGAARQACGSGQEYTAPSCSCHQEELAHHPHQHLAAAAQGDAVTSQPVPPAQWVLLIRSCPLPHSSPPPPPWRTCSSSSSRRPPQQPATGSVAKDATPPSGPTSPGRWCHLCWQLLPWLLQLGAWCIAAALRWAWPPPTAALAGGMAVAALQEPPGDHQRCDACGAGGGGDAASPGDPVTAEVFVTCLLKAELGGWWAPGRPLSPLAGHWQLHAALTRQLLAGLLTAATALVAAAPQQQQQQQEVAALAPGGTGGAEAVQQQQQRRCSSSSSSSGQGVASAGVGWWGPDPVADPVTGVFPRMGCCPQHIWSPLHTPGAASPFSVRGPGYLSGDRSKVAAGSPALSLYSVDLVNTPTPVGHLGRFLPAVRRSPAPYSLVVNMMVPTPAHVINVVMAYGAHWTPALLAAAVAAADSGGTYPATAPAADTPTAAAAAGAGGREEGGPQRQQQVELPPLPFARTLLRFLGASDASRSDVFKMIPHVEGGPWLLRRSIGTTPVILGRKMVLRYATTPRYLEVDVDVTSCAVAGHIVGAVQGLAAGLTVDMAYLLEGQAAGELPEVLAGAVRFAGMDLGAGVGLDMSREIPLRQG